MHLGKFARTASDHALVHLGEDLFTQHKSHIKQQDTTCCENFLSDRIASLIFCEIVSRCCAQPDLALSRVALGGAAISTSVNKNLTDICAGHRIRFWVESAGRCVGASQALPEPELTGGILKQIDASQTELQRAGAVFALALRADPELARRAMERMRDSGTGAALASEPEQRIVFWQQMVRVAIDDNPAHNDQPADAGDAMHPLYLLTRGPRLRLLLNLIAALDNDSAARVMQVSPDAAQLSLEDAYRQLRRYGIDDFVLERWKAQLQAQVAQQGEHALVIEGRDGMTASSGLSRALFIGTALALLLVYLLSPGTV